MTTVEEVLRGHIREALTKKDERMFNQIAATAGLSRLDEVFERLAREELAASSHEVREFWNGQCNCCGVLN